MKNRVLVKRYSRGLISAIGDEEEFTAIYKELNNFMDLLKSREKLKKILHSPFFPLTKKKALLDELLRTLSYSPKTTRFIGLCVENERLEFFQEILEFLPPLWCEKKGVSIFAVSSVVSSSGDHKEKF